MFRLSVLIIGLALVVSGCNSRQIGLTGSGPIQLGPEIYGQYLEYLDSNPIVFSVSADGRTGWHAYTCKQTICRPDINHLKQISVQSCEIRAGKYMDNEDVVCKVYDVNGRIVWDQSGPPVVK
ncbi:hypothetical protein [Kiloniella majae]|uniref:hypothetical protein n=1 Tax=Kiloniella majae TaxID=1938558 RepID=UPI000A277EA8|nr:hypothetical protein [Kiloniella majae]